MNKNQIKSVPKYFDRYINYVPDMDIVPDPKDTNFSQIKEFS